MRLVCNFSPYDKGTPILSLSRKQLRSSEYEILSQLHPVPQTWIDTLEDLRKQEERIIQKRKSLVKSWCEQYDPLIRNSLAKLPTTHPEVYI